jgi:hypothetical protein
MKCTVAAFTFVEEFLFAEEIAVGPELRPHQPRIADLLR